MVFRQLPFRSNVGLGASWKVLLPVITLLSLPLPALPARADEPPAVDLTEAEFKLYHDYLDALSDPRVQKLKPSRQLPAIANNFHVSLGKLRAAVEKGKDYTSLAAIGAACEAAIRRSVEGTPLEGRLDHVQIDTSDPHAVAYVSWKAERLDQLEVEACLLAARVKKAAPISADLELWAEDPQNKEHKVFEGLISGEAASGIRENRIQDFAVTRYIKLFEKVHFDRPASAQ